MAKSEYEVQLSEIAEKTYERMFHAAKKCLDRGDVTNSHVRQLRMVDEVLDRIIPHDPLAPERRLSGTLSGICRVKKGRMRICYIAAPDSNLIRVIYISDTPWKSGDSNDPYKILTGWIRSGDDELLDSLGITKPLRRTTLPSRDLSSMLQRSALGPFLGFPPLRVFHAAAISR
jgi:mRNA-degrading endonuclease RelE of RelBE toxin-antitoxin system